MHAFERLHLKANAFLQKAFQDSHHIFQLEINRFLSYITSFHSLIVRV